MTHPRHKKERKNLDLSAEKTIFAPAKNNRSELLIAYEERFYLCRSEPLEASSRQKQNTIMKKGIHPENYRPVAFKDMSNDVTFISRSTINTKETIVIDGEEYPLVKLEITSASHPFFTGKHKLVDTAGRVDKFLSRYGKKK